MNEEQRTLDAQARLAQFEMCRLVIELNTMKIEFASKVLTWLDELELEHPDSRDSLSPLSERLIDQIERLENEINENFTELLIVSDLNA